MQFFKWEKKTQQLKDSDSSIKLTIEIPQENFKLKENNHIALIQDTIKHFRESLKALQDYDTWIAVGIAATFIAWALSDVSLFIPFGIVSIMLACIVTHRVDMRPEYVKNYIEALDNLKGIYQWVMEGSTSSKLTIPVVQELIMTLGSWTLPSTIHTWEERDVQQVSASHEAFKKKLKAFEEGDQTKNPLFNLYGENGQGDILAFLHKSLTTINFSQLLRPS